MSEVVIGTDTYQLGSMNAMRQFHVMRRVLGLAGALSESLQSFSGSKTGFVEMLAKDPAAAVAVAEPVLRALGKMSDDDAEYVIRSCLGAVRKKVGQSWSPMTAPDGQFMFHDTPLAVVLNLTSSVLSRDLQSFFTELLSGLLVPGLGKEATSRPDSRTTKTG